MLQASLYRFPKRHQSCLLLQKRCYAVRVPGERHRHLRTVADLKAWQPGQLGQAEGTGRRVSDVEVCGWVRSVRRSSAVRFVDITDGSSMRPLQAVVDKNLAADIRPGSAVRLRGTWHSDPSSPPSVKSGEGISRAQERPSPPASGPTISGESRGLNPDSSTDSGETRVLDHPPDSFTASEPPSAPGGDDLLPSSSSSSPPPYSPAASAELRVHGVEILGQSDPSTLPVQNKYQSPESLRSIPHLRPRTPLNSTLLRLRSDAMYLLNRFFFEQGFQETHPPIITSSDCEGAGEAFTVKAGVPGEFFRDPKYLTVSTQLHLEALAQALGNVWTLSPTFRAEQSDTSRHLSEFYMLEAEMSFVQNMDEVMDLVQNMLASLTRGLSTLSAARELDGNRLDARDPAERDAFRDLVDREELQRRWNGMMMMAATTTTTTTTTTGTAAAAAAAAQPTAAAAAATPDRRWPRVTYTEAIEILQPAADTFEHAPVWGAGLQSEHEKYLAEKVGFDETANAYQPVFVTHYPREIKAFYMRRSDDISASSPTPAAHARDTVDCFDLLVPSLGELAGGSMREHRLPELEQGMRLHGLAVPGAARREARSSGGLGWYLDLRRWGCPPHGGFGLGFDRLLSYLTGVHNIRDVVPFPRHFGRCDC